jgi:hypothetical protein
MFLLTASVCSATRTLDGNKHRRRRPGQDASHFKTDDDTGKMIIEGENEDAQIAVNDDVAGAAYKESITSVDGFTRGAKGRVKFNKDTKKRRRTDEANGDNEDVEMTDAVSSGPPRSNKKSKKEAKLGQEFKAKVSHTGRVRMLIDVCNLECWRRRQKRRRRSICLCATFTGSETERREDSTCKRRWTSVTIVESLISLIPFICCCHIFAMVQNRIFWSVQNNQHHAFMQPCVHSKRCRAEGAERLVLPCRCSWCKCMMPHIRKPNR